MSSVLASLLGIILTAIFLLIPVRTLINSLVPKNMALLNESVYSEQMLGFYTDYDKENPVTRKDGCLRVLKAKIHHFEEEEESNE